MYVYRSNIKKVNDKLIIANQVLEKELEKLRYLVSNLGYIQCQHCLDWFQTKPLCNCLEKQ